MSLAVNVKIKPKDFTGIAKERRKEIKQGIRLALSKTAQVGINIILDRTEKGRDIKGNPFKAYVQSYSKFRKAKGRQARPDLDFTGKMLGSMTSKSNNKRAEIFFTRAMETTKAMGNQKKRPFFGFSRSEQKHLAKTFSRFIK